jgi:hypothetical protein
MNERHQQASDSRGTVVEPAMPLLVGGLVEKRETRAMDELA